VKKITLNGRKKEISLLFCVEHGRTRRTESDGVMLRKKPKGGGKIEQIESRRREQ
jgi:hypothetical protein